MPALPHRSFRTPPVPGMTSPFSGFVPHSQLIPPVPRRSRLPRPNSGKQGFRRWLWAVSSFFSYTSLTPFLARGKGIIHARLRVSGDFGGWVCSCACGPDTRPVWPLLLVLARVLVLTSRKCPAPFLTLPPLRGVGPKLTRALCGLRKGRTGRPPNRTGGSDEHAYPDHPRYSCLHIRFDSFRTKNKTRP